MSINELKQILWVLAAERGGEITIPAKSFLGSGTSVTTQWDNNTGAVTIRAHKGGE